MKRIIILMIILCNIVFVEAIETGKINYSPKEKINSMDAEQGVLISNRIVKTGFNVYKKSFYTNLPIFSYTQFKNEEYIGTGSLPYIININKNDTIIKFNEGETVYRLLNIDNKFLIAAVLPKGYIVKIQNNKIDTIAHFENRNINEMKLLNKKIYIAVANKLYMYNNNKFNLIYTANDKNISFIDRFNSKIIIGTEGNGQLINVDDNKVLFSMKNSEIVYACENNNSKYILLNEYNSNNNGKIESKMIKIFDNSIDTVYKSDGFFIKANKNKYGIFLFRGDIPNIVFFDYSDFYNMGNINSDFILNSFFYNNKIIITTGTPGNVYVIDKQKDKSEFYSNIIDFNKQVIINSVSLNTKSRGKLFLRIGNTPEVDSTWSDFLLIKPNMKINIPETRYVQIKYDLYDNNFILGDISLYYKTRNHAPKIDSIKVYTPRILPSYIQENISVYSIDNMKYYPEYSDDILKTSQKVIYIEWQAKDIDNDKLFFDIYLQDKYGLYGLKKNIKNNYAIIYIDAYDEGYYDIKLIANDSLSNIDEPLKSVYIYKNLFIDNTPPIIENVNYKLGTLSFTSKDKSSFINEAYYCVNGNAFVPIIPEDDIFDSYEETFKVNIKRENNETLLISIYVIDVYGNIGRYRKIIK